MKTGNKYIIKTRWGVHQITIIFIGQYAIKFEYDTSHITEWAYLNSFKSSHQYIDPDIMILEKITDLIYELPAA